MKRIPRTNRNTLQHAIGPFLVLAQFMGVLPVSGVWPSYPADKVQFRWISPALLVSCLVLAFSILDCVLSSNIIFENGLKLYTIGSLSFSVICIAGFSTFLLISTRWPRLARQTALVERIFQQPGYDCQIGRQFGRKLRIWGTCLLLFALCEHSTYVGSALYSNHQQIVECGLNVSFWLNYFQRERQELFSVFHFNVVQALFIEWTTLAMTFVWNFMDIFLILICHSIRMRFQQLHWRLRQHAGQHMSNGFWEQLRCDLLELADLLKLYEKELSGLVIVACAQNMYFVCVQVYHSFKARGSYMDELYFWFCLFYVVTRLCNMMFAASAIPQETKHMSNTLFEIPTEFWCQELRRIQEILLNNTFALSGHGFFYLSRRLMFALAATLMAYELVLINQMSGEEVQKSICSRGAGSSKSIFYS